MRTYLIINLLCGLLYSINCTAQSSSCAIIYSYDNAGNRIQRILDECEESGKKGNNSPLVSNDSTKQLAAIVYPNPTLGDFTVEFNSVVEMGQLSLFDNLGRKVYSNMVSGQHVPLNISSFQPGLYYIRIIAGGKIFQKTIMKN